MSYNISSTIPFFTPIHFYKETKHVRVNKEVVEDVYEHIPPHNYQWLRHIEPLFKGGEKYFVLSLSGWTLVVEEYKKKLSTTEKIVNFIKILLFSPLLPLKFFYRWSNRKIFRTGDIRKIDQSSKIILKCWIHTKKPPPERVQYFNCRKNLNATKE